MNEKTEAVDVKEEVKAPKLKYTSCPNCGTDCTVDYQQTDPALVDYAFKCILGGIPRTKSYELAGARIIVEMEEPVGDLMERHRQLLATLSMAERGFHMYEIWQLNALVYVKKVVVMDGSGAVEKYQRPEDIKFIENVSLAYSDMSAKVGVALLAGINTCVSTFMRDCARGSMGMLDINFYKGAGRY